MKTSSMRLPRKTEVEIWNHFQIDHIISVQHGGDTIAANLCLCETLE